MELNDQGIEALVHVLLYKEECRELWDQLQPVIHFARSLELTPPSEADTVPKYLHIDTILQLVCDCVTLIQQCNHLNRNVTPNKHCAVRRKVFALLTDISHFQSTELTSALEHQKSVFGTLVESFYVTEDDHPPNTVNSPRRVHNTDLRRRCASYCPDHFILRRVDIIKAQSTGRSLENLQSDVDILTQVVHPCIAQHYTQFISEDQRHLNIVMEHVDGETLSSRITSATNRHGYTDRQVALWLRQIASALACLHAHQIVHRRLCPQKILLTKHHTIKLVGIELSPIMPLSEALDTGIAKSDRSPWRITGDQVTDVEFDGRDDIYAVGIILYQLLSRSLLVDGTGLKPIQTVVDTATMVETVHHASPILGGQLLPLLLDENRERRPTAAQLCRLLDAYLTSSESFQRVHRRVTRKLGLYSWTARLCSWPSALRVLLYTLLLLVALTIYPPAGLPPALSAPAALGCSVAYSDEFVLDVLATLAGRGPGVCERIRRDRSYLLGFTQVATLTSGEIQHSAAAAVESLIHASDGTKNHLRRSERAALHRLLRSPAHHNKRAAAMALLHTTPTVDACREALHHQQQGGGEHHLSPNEFASCMKAARLHAPLLIHGTIEVQEGAARNLAAIASHHRAFRDEIGRYKLYDALVFLLEESSRPGAELVAWLARDNVSVEDTLDTAGPSALDAVTCKPRGLFSAEDGEVCDVTEFIAHRHDHHAHVEGHHNETVSERRRRHLVEAGAVPLLVRLLPSTSSTPVAGLQAPGALVTEFAAVALGALIEDERFVWRVVETPEVVRGLVALLSVGNESAKRAAALALRTMAEYSESEQSLIVAAGAMAALSALALSEDAHSRVAAHSALMALTVHWDDQVKGHS